MDAGLNQITLTVPFYDLSGASRSNPKSVHIDTDALLETAGVAHPNALQIQSIDVKGVSVGTSVGFRYVRRNISISIGIKDSWLRNRT